MKNTFSCLTAIAAVALATLAGPASAGPNLSFNLDQISSATIGSGTLGTVTLTQNGANEVDVLVALVPNALFVNTGGPHTPFAFNLNSNVPVVTVTVTSPLGGLFLPNASGGGATPYGNFNYAIDYTGANGGGNGNAGPLAFSVTRASGVSTTDFVANPGGYFFAADILGPRGGTGSIASLGPATVVVVPEPASMALFAMGLLALGLARRRKQAVASL